MSRFTHLTQDAQPVTVINDQYQNGQKGWEALVQTRAGARHTFPLAELIPLGSAEAQEILAEVTGQDESAAVEDSTSLREAMAQMYLRCDASRSALKLVVEKVLKEHPRSLPAGARMVLEAGLDVARAVMTP